MTPQAAILWSSVPTEARDRILKAVFCVKCRGSVTLIDFTGEEKKGDLVLTGKCGKCGGKVVRVLELSELDGARN